VSTEQPGPEGRIANSQGFQVGLHNTQTNIGVDPSNLPPPQSTGAGVVAHNLPQASAMFVGRDLKVLADQLDGDDAGGGGPSRGARARRNGQKRTGQPLRTPVSVAVFAGVVDHCRHP
jgi:hypothetical protein